MHKYLLSSGAAIALLAIAIPAQAGERDGFKFGTVSLSLGLGLGTVEADTWGSKANATTKNTYNATASASVTPPEEEEEPVLTSVEENGGVHHHRPVLKTTAHADVTNKSSTDVKGYAYARSGGLAIGAGWGAILLMNREGIFGTTNRSAAIAGGISKCGTDTPRVRPLHPVLAQVMPRRTPQTTRKPDRRRRLRRRVAVLPVPALAAPTAIRQPPPVALASV